jgi:hypothetical protein
LFGGVSDEGGVFNMPGLDPLTIKMGNDGALLVTATIRDSAGAVVATIDDSEWQTQVPSETHDKN